MIAEHPENFAETPATTQRGEVTLKSITLGYVQKNAEDPIIEQLDLTVPTGQFICILGPSGCGKSTLLNAIAGFLPVTRGSILVDNIPIAGANAERGMVFQQNSLLPWKTVFDNIALGPTMAGVPRNVVEARVATLLRNIGLTDYASYYPSELSGGMQQRVCIARSLANQPAVLLMDEPFSALDAQTRQAMQAHLLALWEQHKTTVIFVTHDIEEAVFLADRVLVMSANPGAIVADIAIPFARPRDAQITLYPEFIALRKTIREHIAHQTGRLVKPQVSS